MGGPGRDLPVCRPGGDEPRDLELARTERAGIHIRPDRHLLGERGEKQREVESTRTASTSTGGTSYRKIGARDSV